MPTFLLILQTLPSIIAAIKAIESAVPGSGQGAAKLDAVLNLVLAVESSFNSALPQLTAVITTLVALFNKTGAFKQ